MHRPTGRKCIHRLPCRCLLTDKAWLYAAYCTAVDGNRGMSCPCACLGGAQYIINLHFCRWGTPDPTQITAQRQVVRVENVGGKAAGNATGLYNKHCIYTEGSNSEHPFSSEHPFNRFNFQTNKWLWELINIRGMDWTTSKSNHSNQQMPHVSPTLNSILGFAMIVGLNIIHISVEHYPTGILPHVHSSFLHISQFRCTSILNWCHALTQKGDKHTARETKTIGGGICIFIFLLEGWLYQSFLHRKRLTRPIWWSIIMLCSCISQLVLFKRISPKHLTCNVWVSVGLGPYTPKGANNTNEAWHSTVRTELYPHWNLDINIAAWNGTVLTASRDNIIQFWLPVLGIIQNKS